MMNKETTMIGVEVTGGVKKDRELAEEIVWFCLEKMLPRHRTLNVTVLLTKTYETYKPRCRFIF